MVWIELPQTHGNNSAVPCKPFLVSWAAATFGTVRLHAPPINKSTNHQTAQTSQDSDQRAHKPARTPIRERTNQPGLQSERTHKPARTPIRESTQTSQDSDQREHTNQPGLQSERTHKPARTPIRENTQTSQPWTEQIIATCIERVFSRFLTLLSFTLYHWVHLYFS